MGCCGSTSQRKPFERQASQHGIFSSLALKFPLIRRAFQHVRDKFDKFTAEHGGGDEIPEDQLGPLLESMGAPHLTHEEILGLFDRADLDGSKMMSFREFLIAVAVGYYLDDTHASNESNDDPDYEETRKGFKVIEKAFNTIDTDGGGSIDPEELKKALFSVATSEESEGILEARFAELDIDGDGDIFFPEFLYGFASWVNMTEEDEEADEDVDPELLASLKSAEKNRQIAEHIGDDDFEEDGADDNGSD